MAIPLIPSPVIVEMPTPFELSTKTSLCGSDCNPNRGANCWISAIAPLGVFAIRDSVSIISFVVSLIKRTFGSLRYLDPAEIMSKSLTVSRLSTLTTGGTNAWGLSVLSDA